MAAKKDKGGVDSLRNDVQALTEAFWSFRETMLTDVAVAQSERQVAVSINKWVSPKTANVDETAQIMAALGQPQRLRMVMMLASGPTSVPAMVEELGLKTTGAAYHHLKVLMTSGLVVQPERGTFTLAPENSGQTTSLLAALFDDDVSAETGSTKKKKKNG